MINLKTEREKLGISQEELSRQSGVKRSTINNIERAQAGKIKLESMKLSTAWKLSQALGQPLTSFVEESEV